MINSVIASSHHYYMVFFEALDFNGPESVISLFEKAKNYELVSSVDNNNESVYHLQHALPEAYGSEGLLQANKFQDKRSGAVYYWYDFYFGPVNLDKHIYFLCYPYSKLSRFISDQFSRLGINVAYFKSNVQSVIDHVKLNDGKSKDRKSKFRVEISKYSAQIKESTDAKKISLVGEDPLKSRVFELLSGDQSITIEPIALKIKCFRSDVSSLELSFDRLGNFRFWLRRGKEEGAMGDIKYAYSYLSESKSLDRSKFISSITLLEDE